MRGRSSSLSRGGRVGAAQDVQVVAEDGGDLDLSTESPDVAGDDIDSGDFAAFDLGDPALADAHVLGDVGLRQAEESAAFCEPVAVDVGLVAPAGLGQGFLAAGVGDQAGADVVPPGKSGHELSSSASRSFTYATYSSSARGIAVRYQPDQLPDLSPPTSRIAQRQGSKTNRTRISEEPAEPGLSSLRL
ncbi:hypothetical protein FAIPA1_230032 [Frankia sp. AiPs1]